MEAKTTIQDLMVTTLLDYLFNPEEHSIASEMSEINKSQLPKVIKQKKLHLLFKRQNVLEDERDVIRSFFNSLFNQCKDLPTLTKVLPEALIELIKTPLSPQTSKDISDDLIQKYKKYLDLINTRLGMNLIYGL